MSTGWDLAEAGAERAAEAAGRDWSDRALAMLQRFLANQIIRVFTSEDVRAYADSIGFDLPPDARAYGHVLLRAKRLGLIEHNGYGFSANRQAHRRPVSIWRIA